MSNNGYEAKIEQIVEKISNGIRIIEKQKREAKSQGINTNEITSDEHLCDMLMYLGNFMDDEEINLDELDKELQTRIYEVHEQVAAGVMVLKSLRAARKAIK